MTITVELRPVEDLAPYARKHSEAAITRLVKIVEGMGWTNPILVDADGIVAGHKRRLAALAIYAKGGTIRLPGGTEIPAGEVPVLDVSGWTEEQRRAYILADNQTTLESAWDDDMLRLELKWLDGAGIDMGLTGFDDAALAKALGDVDGGDQPPDPLKVKLADRFGVPPFSVLRASEGWWQDRKRAWLALGIKSELGRGENGFDAAPGGSPMVSGYDKDGKRLTGLKNIGAGAKAKTFHDGAVLGGGGLADQVAKAATFGQDLMRGEHVVGGKGTLGMSQHVADPDFYRNGGNTAGYEPTEGPTASGTSIFDPVLCELAYRWFCPIGGLILDPFAGGSVRGIVASKLGRRYIGCELRAEQVTANRAQAAEICEAPAPEWVIGDSRQIGEHAAGTEADFLFSCPPYADLEVYSDDPADLSTLAYAEFREAYFEIVAESAKLLKDDRFACFVVGEVRGKNGNYYGFVPDTIEAFRRAGLAYYNEAILITAAGSLPIRAGKQFEATRKVGKTHQNVLVFVKGDAKRATQAIGKVEFGPMDDGGGGQEAPQAGPVDADQWGEKL